MARSPDPTGVGRWRGDHPGAWPVQEPVPLSEVDGIWQTDADVAATLTRCHHAHQISRGRAVWVVRRFGIVIGCEAAKRRAERMWRHARRPRVDGGA